MARRPTSIVNIAIRAIDETKRGFSAPIKNAKDLQKAMASLRPVAAAAGAAVTGAFVLISKELIDARQEMVEFSDRIGISVESLSQLKFAAEQNGISFNTLQMGLQRVNRRIGDNTTQIRETVERLGLDFDKLQRAKPGEVLFELARGFEGIGNQQEKLSLAGKLFDAEAIKFLQFMGQGEDALKKYTEQADALGLTIDSKSARAVQRLNEDIGGLTGVVKGLVNEFLTGLLPNLNGLTSQESLDGLSSVQEAFYNIGQSVANFAKGLALFVTAITDVAAPFIQKLFSEAQLGFNKFRDFVLRLVLNLAVNVGNKITGIINQFVNEINQFINKVPKKLRQMMGLEGTIPEINLNLKTNADQIFQGIAQETKQIEREVESVNALLDSGIDKVKEFYKELFKTEPPPELKSPGAITLQPIQPLPGNGEDAGNGGGDNGTDGPKNLEKTINDINVATTLSNELGNALGDIFSGAQRATEAFDAMGQSVMRMLGNIIGQIVKVFLTEKIMTLALGKVIKGAQVAAAIGYKSMIPVLSTAATLSAIATGGASLKAAVGVPIAVAANNAIVGGLNMMMGSMFGGQAHDGLTNVPREGTFLLNKGERVIAPEQNEDLTQFLAGNNAGAPTEISINLDGEILARSMENLVDRNVVNINASSVI